MPGLPTPLSIGDGLAHEGISLAWMAFIWDLEYELSSSTFEG